MPRVGEVQDVGRLLDHPDDVGPVLQRIDERRDVAATEQVGDTLEVVEAQVLLGQEDDEVVGQGTAQRRPAARPRDTSARSIPVTVAPSAPATGSTVSVVGRPSSRRRRSGEAEELGPVAPEEPLTGRLVEPRHRVAERLEGPAAPLRGAGSPSRT